MTTYKDSLNLEARGFALIDPLLQQWSAGAPLERVEGKIAQKLEGDRIVTTKSMRRLTVEVKIVEGVYDKFFFETWSNRSESTPGWLCTCMADRLVWLFLASRELFIFDLKGLTAWLLSQNGREAYPEVPQRKCEQLNDTWGILIPRTDIRQRGLIVKELTLSLPPSPAKYLNDHACSVCGAPDSPFGFCPPGARMSEIEWRCRDHQQ